MGACATFSPWTLEDDLLLKNSVESGASLEALAKGAVQFSRRYSIGEIKERWHSVFFDAVVSSEASAAMIRLKEQEIVSVKRKPVRARDSYYAMRKRMRKEVQTSMDYNFLVEPENENYAVNGDVSLPLHCVHEGSTWNQFQNNDLANYGLPENIMDAEVAINGVTDQAFYTGVDDTLGENFLIGQNHMPVEEHQLHQIIEDNVPLDGAAEEVGVPIDLDIENFIRDEDVEEIPLSSFYPINNNPANLCSKFDEDYLFDSSELECGDSFDDLQLSSLPDIPDIPDIPDWRTEEHGGIPCHGSKDSTGCEHVCLKKLSNDLLTFTSDEELYLMDCVGKDEIRTSYYDGLSSLIENSPIDGSSGQIPKTDGAELLPIPPEEVKNPCVSRRTHINDNAGTAETDLLAAFDAHVNDLSASRRARAEVDDKSELEMPTSASAKYPQFPEIVNGAIICKTNTEDPEIPSNDDVSLPFNEPPPTNFCSSEPAATKSNKPVSSSVNDCGFRASRRGKVLMHVEQKNSIGAHVSSQTTGTQVNSGPVSGSKIKCELPNNHSSHTLSKSADIASSGLGGGNSLTNKTHAALHANPKEKLVNASFVKHLSSNVTSLSHEKPALGNRFLDQVQPNGSCLKQEPSVALPVEDNNLQRSEMGSTEVLRSELVVNPEKFEEEEQYIESDDDVPYYSDIEAMILDMDLEPDVHDLYENEEVSRYQHEETKRTIVRLEQGVHSSMQRAMASHGALALLYGRRSNYYIKKPEVLLGRATEGVHVDIDLSRGGGTNLISRRQAIIKMDKDGLFYIKNIGKSSMVVNNRELHTDQSQRLLSHHLIELKGMQLIFEINQSCMQQ